MPTVDERLTQAALALRHHAASLEAPPLRVRRSGPALAAAAGVFVILAIAGAMAFQTNGSTVAQQTYGEAAPLSPPDATGEYSLPDGRALLVRITPNGEAATSGAEFCVGSEAQPLCVSADTDTRVAWSIAPTTDEVCPANHMLLYGITSLPAAEFFEYKAATSDGRTLAVSDVVHPRVVPVPQSALPEADTMSVGGMVETFASCVPTGSAGVVALLGGFSQDLGRNAPIATDVPMTPTSR